MNKGFIALILVLSVAGLLLAFVADSSIQSALFFDQATKKEYRAINNFAALNCIDQAILGLSEDYFFLTSTPIFKRDLNCTIISVIAQDTTRLIVARGDLEKAYVYHSAIVRMNDTGLEVIKIE